MKAQPEKLFLHHLALRLGMTVGRLLDEIDSRELCDWMAFFALERERMDKAALDGGKPVPVKGDVGSRLKAAFGAYNTSVARKKSGHKGGRRK